MTMRHVEVMASVERRRRWPRAEKERLVAACFEPGVTASEVARLAGIHASQLFRWRKELCVRSGPNAQTLIPVEVVSSVASPPRNAESPRPTSAPVPVRRRRKGIIEIELDGGRRIRVDRDVDARALRRVLDALAGDR